MSEVAQAPQLRFPEFNHDWSISTIGNLAKIDTGNRDTQDRVNSGKYPFYVRSNTVERINEYTFDGEAILTSGDGVGVGKNFHYVIGKFNYHQRVYSIHNFTNLTNGKFVYYYFADKFYRRVSRLSAKNSVDSVRMSMISDMPISIPTKPEQQKIAEFLTAVDNKIEQLSKKQELLSEYKKGLMQKIFSQAIRFKADDGSDFSDWEQVKLATLSKLVTKQTGYDYSSTIKPSLETSKDDSNIPFVQNKDFNSTSINLNTDFYVPVSVQKKYPRITLDEKCLLITISGNIGNVGVYNKQEKAFIGGAVCVAKFKDKDNIDFVKYYLTTDIGQKMMLREVKASSHQNITVEGIRNFRIMLPYLEEQKKIVVFLSIIDNKIEQAGKQLIESKQFKKALLQQMFV